MMCFSIKDKYKKGYRTIKLKSITVDGLDDLKVFVHHLINEDLLFPALVDVD